MTQDKFIEKCNALDLQIVDYGDRLFGFRKAFVINRIELYLAAVYNSAKTPPEDFGGVK